MKKKSKQILITLEEYTKRINAIIDKCQSVSDTLIDLLEEAAKYKIKENK